VYLVDTNVWLERLLDQERSDEVGRFLDQVPSEQLSISDFAFHSIGVILIRMNQERALLSFAQDVFADGAVSLVHLEPGDIPRLVQVAAQFNLDFDDAYQYVAAEKYSLMLVSYDSDFDRTDCTCGTPADVLQGIA